MAILDDSPVYEEGIYQLEITDPVQGGAGGVSNLQAKQLGRRTAFLKQQVDNLKGGTSNYVADSGAVNALVADTVSDFAAYVEGMPLRIKVAVTNTGACTLALDGLAPKAIKKFSNVDLEAGDLLAGDVITLVYDGAAWQLQSAGRRALVRGNYIINGNFDIWQRGTNLAAATSTGRYLADRWFTASTGSTIAPSQQAFALGQGVVPGEPAYFHRCVVASVAGAANFARFGQRIEGVRTLAGKTVRLSFWGKADANKNVAVELIQNFGTGGAPSAAVTGLGVTTLAFTNAWQLFEVTVAIPSIAGKTLGTNGDDSLEVGLWLDAGGNFGARTNNLGQQNSTIDIARVKLEEGTVTTPFTRAGGTLGGELALCQRYYETANYQVLQGALGTATPTASIRFQAKKRAVPTLTIKSMVLGTANKWSSNSLDIDDGAYRRVDVDFILIGPSASTYANNYAGCYWMADAEL